MKIRRIAVSIAGLATVSALCFIALPAGAESDHVGMVLRCGREGFHRADLVQGDPAAGLTVSAEEFPQAVLAIRVDFLPDTTSTTTGTGKFDLSASSDEVINPPPHDRIYFQRQMEALHRYYLNVSRGLLDFSCEVYPQENDAAYTLPNEMAYYSPNLTESENDRRLAEFFRDALETADAAGTIDFSQFDALVIFHAGVGADIAFSYDETPNDIPSAYMDLEWLSQSLGSQYAQGVPVNGGTYLVQEGLWMPETLNQRDVEFGLTGLMALLFGHRLGLPNLYNSADGSSGIGSWGLMDQGSGNELGLIPAVPCAWSRIFLGWERPVLVRDSLEVAIDALVVRGSNTTVLKVPINADEYFLIENRQRDAWGDSIVAQIEGGVLLEVDEYDWGIPGSGLLIWHVDEKVIRENYESNTVNADPYHRGVDLEEADGFQDIGHILYGGYVTYGMPEDAFYQGNNTAFTPTSNPNSNSYSGADSHIFVTGIGPSGATMTCDVSIDTYQPGWPDSMAVSLAENPPLVGDLDGDGDMEIVMNTPDGRVFVWNHDGTPFLPGADSSALFVQLADSIAGSAALGDLDEDGDQEIVLGAVSGDVHCWNHDGEELDGFPFNVESPISSAALLIRVPGVFCGTRIVVGTANGWVYELAPGEEDKITWRVNLGESTITALTVADGASWPFVYRVIAGTANGQVFTFCPLGEGSIEPRVIQTPAEIMGLVWGDLDRDDQIVEIIATCAGGQIYVWDLYRHLTTGWPVQIEGPLSSSPVLGDIDGDGYLEVVVVGTDEIWAWNYNGSPVSNFPIPLKDTGTMKSSPILGDVDGDGQVDIVVGTPAGLLVAHDRFGDPLQGWPLACAGAVNSSPTLADIDGDGDIEILAGDEAGWMYVWDLAAEPDSAQLPWPTWGHDFRHTGGFPSCELPSPPQAGELMPAASVYNYPNPTEGQSTTIRYRLGQEAEVDIRIYDLSGDLVADLPGTGFAHTENEVVWDLSDVVSGVYLCRVEARGGGYQETVFCKIAVVK
ncbi:VCBS repeat-containing protein [bacterium]|nr:VCBS repeat-containing protein [bacterium]